MCRVRAAHRAGFHLIGLMDGKNAPLMDAMAIKSVNIAFIMGRPAGAALNLEPRSWLKRPFRVGLPPAVKHPMRGYIHPFQGAEARRYSFNLLMSLFFWVTEVCYLQHQREKPVNRPINTTQIESGTQDVGDKWVFRAFKAQWAETSTHTSLI